MDSSCVNLSESVTVPPLLKPWFHDESEDQSYLFRKTFAVRPPTLKDILELVLLQAGPHHLLDGADVLVQLDHQRVIVHALHVGHYGVVALLGQGNEVMEAVHPGGKKKRAWECGVRGR